MSKESISEINKLVSTISNSQTKLLISAIMYILHKISHDMNFGIEDFQIKTNTSFRINDDLRCPIHAVCGQKAVVYISYHRFNFRIYENITFYVTDFSHTYYERMNKLFKI